MAENKVKDGNYIMIQSFMVKDLKLKGNELLVYAIIYGFSQEENCVFSGSLQYLADWTNSTKQGIMKCLKSLEEKCLIVKQSLMVNKVVYSTKFNASIKQSLTGSIKQSLPNNIVIDNKINNKINTRALKHQYGEFKNVLLTDEEVKKLQNDYANDYLQAIEYLSEYIAMKNYKAKSHYLALRKWVFDALREKRIKEQELNKREQRVQVDKPKYVYQPKEEKKYCADLDSLYDSINDLGGF